MKLAALIVLAVLVAARPAGTSAQTAPLPACVDQQYSVDAAGTTCQIRGETTPTALCRDGTFDYSRRFDACLGHGGVYLRIPIPASQSGSGSGHTWYTSDEPWATNFYCDDDPQWKTLVDAHRHSFATVAELLQAYPGRMLHQQCKDGATGP